MEQMRNKTVDFHRKVRDWEATANALRNKTDNFEAVIADLQKQDLLLSAANNQLRIDVLSLRNTTSALEDSSSTLFNRTINLFRQTDFTHFMVETLQAHTNISDNNTFEVLSRKYKLHFFMTDLIVFALPCSQKN